MLGEKVYETEFTPFQAVRLVASLSFWPTPRAGDNQQVGPLLAKATPNDEEAAAIGFMQRINADGTSAYAWDTRATGTLKRLWSTNEARLLRLVIANPPEGVKPWVTAQIPILNDMLRQLGAEASELYDEM